ncbi:hypothetical protein RRF57_006307 [Xylaria bambusicola]|uniref:Rhodopsin domain-containing protein n=1 Tax=Xylaria bambusicola TaxID=326684 RepID=A0AAN7Z6P9_9PEZI
MDDLPPLSKGAIDALKSLFVALASIAVILRLITNWKYNRRLLVDDYISISAIPFLIATAILSDAAGNGFHDDKIPPYRVAQLAVAISVLTPLALWTCKAPILFLYLRLFGIKKWLRVLSYVTLALTAAVYIAAIVAIPPVCTPHTMHLSEAFITGCQTRTRITNVVTGSFSVLADVVILVLPLPVIFGLNLLVRSKVGLLFLFLSGLFAIGASILSLYFKAISLQRPATSLALSILATITESAVALIVGCVPSLRVLWSKILKPGVKTTSSGNVLSSDPTGNRTKRGTSQYVVVGEGTDRKTSESNTVLIVSTSTEVRTTSEVIDYPHQPQQFQIPQHQLPPHVYDSHGRADDTQQRPFGVYAEAYALQTRQNGIWGR